MGDEGLLMNPIRNNFIWLNDEYMYFYNMKEANSNHSISSDVIRSQLRIFFFQKVSNLSRDIQKEH